MNTANVIPLRPIAYTILVVEDEVLSRLSVADALRAAGYRVLEASTADEALAILRRMPVHLLFADIHMPGGASGLDVARAAQDQRPRPKIILTSGRVGPEEVPGMESIGPFVQKPYPVERVLDLVRQRLDPAVP